MKHKFTACEESTVLDFLSEKLFGVSRNSVKQLIKKREIKLNGNRISENAALNIGDIVEVFVPKIFVQESIVTVFEDENILVVDKPPHTSVTEGLTDWLETKYRFIRPVHRLDTNTRGLVVFAKNAKAEEVLLAAFKQRTVEKKYHALAKGVPKEGLHRAFLYKDDKQGICHVSDESKSGYKEIITACKILKIYDLNQFLDVLYKNNKQTPAKNNNTDKTNACFGEKISEVELTLVTGRTHQLRAHLSFLGCPILGDDKYGDYALNKALKKTVQQLAAVSIEFQQLDAPLEYLSGKKITLDFSFFR